MKIGIVLLSMLLANGREPASMEHADLEDFKRRIGIDALVTKLPQEGIRADWSTLPLVISRHTKGMKLHYHDVAPLAGGLGIGSWTWRSKDAELVIKAAVAGSGQRPARDYLLSVVSSTSRVTIAYERWNPGLGDLAIRSIGAPSNVVKWLFKNVCVAINVHGGQVSAEAIARLIQSHMESHVVANVSTQVPQIEAIDVFPRSIHVDDEVRLEVRLAKSQSLDALETGIDQGAERLLEAKDVRALTGTYRAARPGKTQIEVRLMDRKTLLSPALSVPIEVLP